MGALDFPDLVIPAHAGIQVLELITELWVFWDNQLVRSIPDINPARLDSRFQLSLSSTPASSS